MANNKTTTPTIPDLTEEQIRAAINNLTPEASARIRGIAALAGVKTSSASGEDWKLPDGGLRISLVIPDHYAEALRSWADVAEDGKTVEDKFQFIRQLLLESAIPAVLSGQIDVEQPA